MLWLLRARKLAQSSRCVIRMLVPSATMSTIFGAPFTLSMNQTTCRGASPGRSIVLATYFVDLRATIHSEAYILIRANRPADVTQQDLGK